MEHVVSLASVLSQFKFTNTHAITVHFVNGYLIVVERKIGGQPNVQFYVSDDMYLHAKPICPKEEMGSANLHDLIMTFKEFLFTDDDIKEMLSLTDQEFLKIQDNMQPILLD